jgi:hypothetical protein
MLVLSGGTYYFDRQGGRMTAILPSERPELSATTLCGKTKEKNHMFMGIGEPSTSFAL